MVGIVVIIVPHSSIPYEPNVSLTFLGFYMKYNKEAKSLTCWRASGVGQETLSLDPTRTQTNPNIDRFCLMQRESEKGTLPCHRCLQASSIRRTS